MTATPLPRPMVRFDRVTKAFGATTVLNELSLEVARGEKLVFVGPSGSGKSTLLRILMTLENIDGGSVEIDGQPLWHRIVGGQRKPADRAHLQKMRDQVGMVFQMFNLFPHMTALQNVALAPRRVLGLSRAESERRAAELLAKVGLSDKVDSYPARLSGGQQQRVAIARALAMRPKLMLFDEVTSALDPELVGEVLQVIRELAREHDLTMILVTHEMGFAREIADRVCFFEGGRIVEQGPPDRVLVSPVEPRTRAFLNAVLKIGPKPALELAADNSRR
ncbi:MAG: ectoine/hydroxyectoine ABC transporter ATP-binding protein EhuA [Dongiaceae bacterium]